MKSFRQRLHPVAGMVAMLCIALFLTSTLIAELFLSSDAVAAVKRGILYGLAVLIPAIAVAGWSGTALASGSKHDLVAGKKKRMPIVALNGLLILLPAAFYLHSKAAAGEFDRIFYGIQLLELTAGSINLILLSLNLRDGLRLTGKIR